MKIIAISDTHMQHDKLVLPEGDMIIHAGDMLNRGRKEELFEFSQWWKKLDFKFKLIVPGNHDWVFQKDETWAREMLSETSVLIDEMIVIEGLKIYGTPWQPVFNDWAFNMPEELRKSKFSEIPMELDVLVSHAPPRGVCDVLPKGENVGDYELLKAIAPRKIGNVICGHIHNGYGRGLAWETIVNNVAVCNERYEIVNKPVVIEL